MLRDISPSQKHKYRMISLIEGTRLVRFIKTDGRTVVLGTREELTGS